MKKILSILCALFVAGVGFSQTLQKTGLYNLSKPNWEERPEYLYNLNGDWENGENSVSFTDSRINFCCIENDDWYIVNGLFTADEHNLYISIQDGNSLSVKYDSPEQVIPYTLSEHGNSLELNLKFAGKIFKFKKISNSVLPRRRQNGLNGIWKSEKAWKKATDWNITLKFLEESFLIKIEGGFFSYSLLGDVFYERGMMFITKIHGVENEYYPADVKFGKDFRSSNYDYAIDYVVDYAAQHELPEYIFLGARLDSPYHSLCNYRVEKDTLTIMAYDKEIKLYKQNSKTEN